ncbi:STAS domain-containing protein [Pseudonocardia hispaniensis]|uniref:STAS domain-containing protein n=1 Tax=Pseudonocardia hispaniensis TaxID=904933 RepID=A0ABW1J562_9PSEU
MSNPAVGGPLEIRVHHPAPAVVVVRPLGALDAEAAPQLITRVEFHLGCGRHVVIDLQDLGFLGPSGLHALLELYAVAKAAALRLYLTGVDGPAIAEALAFTGLSRVLPVTRLSTEELVAALTHPLRRDRPAAGVDAIALS